MAVKNFRAVEDIDLFTGALAERSLEGAVVGPTIGCLLGVQFQKLRQGDRFWYENDLPPSAFNAGTFFSIKIGLNGFLSYFILFSQTSYKRSERSRSLASSVTIVKHWKRLSLASSSIEIHS